MGQTHTENRAGGELSVNVWKKIAGSAGKRTQGFGALNGGWLPKDYCSQHIREI
jgi:hypothetical protein